MQSKRTEKLKYLLEISEAIDQHRHCLRNAKKQLNYLESTGLQLDSARHNVSKYERVIRILEIRYERVD